MNHSIVVIGGANVDYTGNIKIKENLYESNPGVVDICFGGVARNITENLARQGIKPSFITAVGNDFLGSAIKQQLDELGVKFYTPNGITKTGCFLSINNSNGNLLLGICDANYIDKLTPEYIHDLNIITEETKYLILDSNITNETLDYIFNNYSDKYIFADGISSGKVIKLLPYLNKIDLLKVNIFEGMTLTKKEKKEEIIQELLRLGVKTVVMTCGKDDTIYNIGNVLHYEPIIKVDNVVNTTGAGDSFLSGVIIGKINNRPIQECVRIGHKMSSYNVLVKDTVNPQKITNLY